MTAAVRGVCAFGCAVALHAGVAALAAACGWLSPEGVELPTLDLTTVELSFSEAPDETAAPASSAPSAPEQPPESAVRPLPPPAPSPMELPPDSSAIPVPEPPQRLERKVETPIPPDPPKRESDVKPEVEKPIDEKPPEKKSPEEKPPVPSVAAPSAPAPMQARVEADERPTLHRPIKPKYPRGARERHEEGTVTLELRISAEGQVEGVKVVSSCGFAELDSAAVEAARKARFNPARREGRPIPYSARISLTFKLK